VSAARRDHLLASLLQRFNVVCHHASPSIDPDKIDSTTSPNVPEARGLIWQEDFPGGWRSTGWNHYRSGVDASRAIPPFKME